MKMRLFTYLLLGLAVLPTLGYAQISFEGDFRMRWYSDTFSEAMDNRDKENYFRYASHLRMKAPISKNIKFQSEALIFMDNNPTSPVRNIAGTGKMYYGVTKIFADVVQPDFMFFDVARLRVGRQDFSIGKGLSLGDSYYLIDGFDGVRVDLSFGVFTLSSLAAITEQNVSESGLYPDPGSDQLYATRLGFPILDNDVIAYHILDKQRGIYNDNQILGCGFTGDRIKGRLEYFSEFAYQQFHTASGLPEKGGLGYMAGISYRQPLAFFRSVKIETRYAAYQGDDASTEKVEQFSPAYPAFYWGSRTGYVDGLILGSCYPYDGKNLEGCRIWYNRIYFITKWMPKLRLQFDYVMIDEYIDNDDYNRFDDEFAVKLYYNLSKQARLHFRYSEDMPNGEDKDINNSGVVAWSEDRVSRVRYMLELQVKF